MKNGETFNLKLFKGLLCNLGSLYFKSYDCCIWLDNLTCAFQAIIWRPDTPQVFDSCLRVVNFYQQLEILVTTMLCKRFELISKCRQGNTVCKFYVQL